MKINKTVKSYLIWFVITNIVAVVFAGMIYLSELTSQYGHANTDVFPFMLIHFNGTYIICVVILVALYDLKKRYHL